MNVENESHEIILTGFAAAVFRGWGLDGRSPLVILGTRLALFRNAKFRRKAAAWFGRIA